MPFPASTARLLLKSRSYLVAMALAGGAALSLLTAYAALGPRAPVVVPGVDREAEAFRDCPVCPQMLIVPAGSFYMGGPPRRRERLLYALGLADIPQPRITITAPFAVGRYEVTFDEWDACVADGGCGGYLPKDEGWGRGNRPVIHISWRDAQAYVQWLSVKTGETYRLLTEAEWEYAARAGGTATYPWGNEASHDHANYGEDECCRGRMLGRDTFLNTAPVGRFAPNGFGLHDMIGNVYEWVEDCYAVSRKQAPADGSAVRADGCPHHVLRGAAWYSDPGRITSFYRAYQTPDRRDYVIGMRVAKTLR